MKLEEARGEIQGDINEYVGRASNDKGIHKSHFPKLKGYAMFLVDKNVLCIVDKITNTQMQDLFFMNMKLTNNMFSLKKVFFTEY